MNPRGGVDHVTVGENQAVGSEHEARATALPFTRFARAAPAGLGDIDFNYRRAQLFSGAYDRLGIRIEQRGIAEYAAAYWLNSLLRIIRERKGRLIHDC